MNWQDTPVLNKDDFTFLYETDRWDGPRAGIARSNVDGRMCYWDMCQDRSDRAVRSFLMYWLDADQEKTVLEDVEKFERMVGTHWRLLPDGSDDPSGEFHGKEQVDYFLGDRVSYWAFVSEERILGQFSFETAVLPA